MPAWRREKYYQKEQYKQLGNITKKNNKNNQEILPKRTIETIRKYYQKEQYKQLGNITKNNNKNNQEKSLNNFC